MELPSVVFVDGSERQRRGGIKRRAAMENWSGGVLATVGVAGGEGA
jgi:hypothetical protein